MLVHIAETDTEHPHGPPSEAWSTLGAADDSTLPADGDDLLRLRLHDTSGTAGLPLESTAVWVPDLGVYYADVHIDIDRTDVITISTRGG